MKEEKEPVKIGLSLLDGITPARDEEIESYEKALEEEKQKELKAKKELHYATKSNVPLRYLKESLYTYKPTEANRKQYNWLCGFVKSIEKEENTKNILYINGRLGTGKAEWVEQVIPTPQGFRRFGDLKTGDYVYGSDGKPTKILGVYPQGLKDVYKITFLDGRTDECALEHLWGVYTRSHGKWEYHVLTVAEMLSRGILTAKNTGRFYIPSSPVIEGEKKDLSCNPYILGSFIGNGCNTGDRLCLSSADEWQVKKCASILNCSAVKCKSNYNWIFKKEHALKAKDILPKEILCYSHEKRIPLEYLFADIQQRKELLQGLFDTDGSVSVIGNRLHIAYTTTSKGLCEDVRNLLLSFGIVSTVRKDERENRRVCYNLCVNCSPVQAEILFTLPRKLERVKSFKRKKRRDYSKVAIKKIEKLSEKKEMMCIYVENESHLYLTKDFLVTHNTHLACGIIRELGGYILTSLELCIAYDSCRDFKATETRWQFLKRLCTEKVLVIDEVGKGIESIEKQILPYIVNEFYGNRNLLIFVGNGEEKDLYKLIGEAGADRMNEVGLIIPLIGESIRGKK